MPQPSDSAAHDGAASADADAFDASFDCHAPPLRLAVIGAGPAGLALALLAARYLPQAQVSLFDARPLERDVSGDPRTIAYALGAVARARGGISKLAREAGMNRQALHKALSGGRHRQSRH